MPILPALRARQATRVALLAPLLFASCVRAPAESPAPVRTGDPAPAAAATISARRWSPVRAPGSWSWQVETVAFVDVAGDSAVLAAAQAAAAPAPVAADSAAAPPAPAPATPPASALASRDSVRSVATFSLALTDTAGGLALSGTLDSLVVLSPRAPARRPLLAPVPVAGWLDTVAHRLTITGEADSAAACAGPSRGATLLARELVIALPRTLERGQRWTDSAMTVTCRADIPVTNRATHEYEVIAIEDRAGVPALAIRRTTRATIAGAATLRGRPLALAGETTGEAMLSVDPADGRLHASTGTSTTRLTLTAEGSSRSLVQQATTRVTLQPR